MRHRLRPRLRLRLSVAPTVAMLALVLSGLLSAATAAPAFRVADAVADGGDRLHLWLDPGWEGWRRDGPRTVEISVDGGAPAQIEPVMAGLHPIAGLAPGRDVAVRVRVTGAGGPEPWSAPQRATPTAASLARFAVWADGFHDAPLDATVTHLAAAPMTDAASLAAGAAALNRPLALPGGGELEYVGGPDSLFVRWFAYEDPANRAGGPNPAPRPVPEVRRRMFDPVGRHSDLAPLQAREVAFFVRAAGDRADRRGAAVVLGGAGAAGQLAVAAVGLDADGDPVAFRFDRPALTGLHPDGRPWVVGPVRILRNGAAPVAAAPGVVVAKHGALLSVVARPGLVPAPDRALAPDFDPDYVATVAADWSDWRDDARRATSGLIAQAQFESLHLQLDSDDPAPAQVRFRRRGGSIWFAAQNLIHDPRRPGAGGGSGAKAGPDMRAVTPGAHRGPILHLAPGAPHEVEVRQGGRYWRVEATTLGYKPTRLSSTAVGVIDGDYVIAEGGRPGAAVEHHTGVVRGGRVLVAASHVILRDIDVLGAPGHAIDLAPGVRDVRIVRGRISGWGGSDLGVRPTNLGWGRHFDSAIAGGEPAAAPRRDRSGAGGGDRSGREDGAAQRAAQSRDDVAVIGARIGAPRFSANAWEEWNPARDAEDKLRPNTNEHPWGPYAISVRGGSWRGGWTVTDSAIAAPPLRAYNDALGGDHNKTADIGGFGPNFVLAYSYIAGAADDLVEHEGSAQVGVILGNFFDAIPTRSFTRSPRAHLGLSTPYWGPTYIVRNTLRRQRPDDFAGREIDGRAFKIQRSMPDASDIGRIVLLHNTLTGAPMVSAMTGSGGPLRHVTGRNNLFHTRVGDDEGPPTGDGVDWRDGSASAPRGATALANVNDAGPWAWEGPPVFGAAAAPR